jgi:hypothetical protein
MEVGIHQRMGHLTFALQLFTRSVAQLSRGWRIDVPDGPSFRWAQKENVDEHFREDQGRDFRS